MKPYKVTYYDGKGKQNLFVKAASTNQAVAEAKQRLWREKVKGAIIIGAERVPGRIVPAYVGHIACEDWQDFIDHMDSYARSHVIRDPKLIEAKIKGKKYKYESK